MSDNEKRYSGTEDEGLKPALLVKKKKKSEKPGYKMFDADESDEEAVLYDESKTPTAKLKKHSRPSFKFAGKIKLKEKEKDERKETIDRKDEKETRRQQSKKFKESKDKEPKIRKKKEKLQYTFGRKNIPMTSAQTPAEATTPVFEVSLPVAVERTPSYDGVQLPVVVRECIDYIEEHGLLYEGIYRISGVKSKVQMLKDAYNRQAPAYLYEHDPSIVASLLKQFIRELPETILTNQLATKFEEASVEQSDSQRVEKLRMCVDNLPPCNKELLSWMIVHMNHVIAKEKINKMSLQNVSIVLSPTMRISHRVLNVLFMHSEELFAGVHITRYRPPLQPAASKWSVDLPEDEKQVENELYKQEALLNILHQELHGERLRTSSRNAEKEELVWEVQRNVTQLKRKLKLIAKTKAARQQEQQLSADSVKRADPNRRSINAAELNFALQTGSLRRNNRSSQVELASSPASVSTSTEALAGQQRHSDLSGKTTRASQRTSTSSEPPKTCHEDIGEPVTSPNNLDLHPLEPEATELRGTTLSPVHGETITQVEVESPEATDVPVATFTSLSIDDSGKAAEDEEAEIKISTSRDSDITLSPYTEAVSVSQYSLTEHSNHPEPPVEHAPNLLNTQEEATMVMESLAYPTNTDKDQPLDVNFNSNQSKAESEPASLSECKKIVEPVSAEKSSHANTDIPSILLIPERLHAGSNQHDNLAEATDVYNIADDDELRLLIAEEAQLIWEEEELIAIKDELRQKIDTEVIEIDRLHEEIAEYEELRSITTLGHSSEAMSSDEYYTSTSDTDPEDEDAAMAELDSLVLELQAITDHNNKLEAENADSVKKIHEERMGCVNVKIQIRLLQQQILSPQSEEQSLI